ncbi:MAG: helix-turn-helix transcriptional regulator [Acidobacteria bacterium]|jgi:PadR family transcriptional regulator, regulatory protein PadR|nr:helix-turn-helix transcriptional regulator [Acidobacteriota bacterium]
MGREGMLGMFEEQVLLAMAHLGEEAYGMTVRREIEARTGQNVTIGAVYATLDRLEAKRMVESWLGETDGTTRRAAKRFLRLRPEGAEALHTARDLRARMWKGLNPARLTGGRPRS